MPRLNIGRKLQIGAGAMLASLLVLGAFSIRGINRLGESLDRAVNSTAKRIELAGKTRDAFRDLRRRSERTQVAYTIGELERRAGTEGGGCSACHQPPDVAQTAGEVEAAAANVRRHAAELRRLMPGGERTQTLAAFEEGAARWVEYTKNYLTLAHGQRFDDAHAVLEEKMFPLAAEVEKAAEVLTQQESEALSSANQEARQEIYLNRWAAAILMAFSGLVGAAVFWLIVRIGATLRGAVKRISDGIGGVSSVSAQVSAASNTLAQGASEQAASLEETSASTAEINSRAQRNSEYTERANRVLSESQKQFRETDSALGELVSAMEAIDASGGKISRIIKVIEEIAFQTNLLALNAAVEAARAGSVGAGFAVVADEVRNLAQRCSEAAKDTAGLIEESIERAHQGRQKVERVAAAIRITSEQATALRGLVDEVSTCSREQARNLEHVAKALAQVESVTRANAANAEQNAAAGQELSGQAVSLAGAAEQLRVMVDG